MSSEPTPTPEPPKSQDEPPSDSPKPPKKRPVTLYSLFPDPLVLLPSSSSKTPIPPRQKDEHCIFYCYQTSLSREKGAEPVCKSFCWRRLYPHERPERPKDADKDAPWFNDRYVYFGRGKFRMEERLKGMSQPGMKEHTTVADAVHDKSVLLDEERMKTLEHHNYAILIPLAFSPDAIVDEVRGRAERLFAPSQRFIDRYIKSFETGGAQERLANTLWQKFSSGEALRTGKRVAEKMWETLGGGRGDSGTGGHGSPPPPPG